MKKLLVSLVKKIITLFPNRNKIIFESIPDFSGNSKAVFDGMIKKKLNKKYKLIWLVEDTKNFRDVNIPNVYFYNRPIRWIYKIQYLLYLGNVKFKITENACYPKIHSETVALHLGHGAPIKNTHNWMFLYDDADYALYLSEPVKENTRKLYGLKDSQMICCGFPRNDELILNLNIQPKEQYIVWLPTFRQSKLGERIDSSYHFPFGIPIFQTIEQLKDINELLKSLSISIYIKPHYAADVKKIKEIDFSNIKIIDDYFYQEQGKSFYEFLGQSKALITDYSSVFFDYLLTDKPIAITLDDYEEYSNGVGLIIENYKDLVHAKKVYNFIDLKEFLAGINNSGEITHQLIYDKNYYHKYLDADSTERVIKFLESKGL